MRQSHVLRAAPGRRVLTVAALVLAAAGLAGSQGQAAAAPLRAPGKAFSAAAGRATTGIDSPSGVTGGALFGGNYPVVNLESSLGRKLAIVRLYYFIGSAFPGPAKYRDLLAHGQTVLASIDTRTSYAAIASGQRDAELLSFLKSVNRAAVQYHLGSIYVSFTHEPDSTHHRMNGAPVQFLQAWDHVHQLAVANHLDWNDGGRLHWVLILIHNTYKQWRVKAFWPGPSEVDIVAADGYNSFGCGHGGQHTQQTPTDTMGPVVDFAKAHGGMPVFLAEWGSDDIPAGEQATYIKQMRSFVSQNKVIAGALYWDTHAGNCDYRVNGDAASISALTAMGHSAALQGHV